MKADDITKDDFVSYEKVRLSGVTNMFDVPAVIKLSELSRETIITIMQNYGELDRKYPGVRNNV